ncbi:PREDICTED: E3 ubiquitin-protein ligase RNF4-like [Polistes dominula]|uniref:E3 ubiquitin-protein ligase RNF4-like n=1 Tax=Polistes dominula TaxID=743375 RepID=A0ABM1IIJ0_POLDO|nr:PREDICTED: E3 ubiquitin-protein ligase RNF4-like [Polistes dominula]XP_015180028.1 PREDICTED: E3 ubiquitin-protein ligase RNF4-like [Polistes dominula]XP_015180029.1 PREDICTED: E3 ubiquitin-protein ligase RNF4-like [Polistes dominula]
MASTRRNNRLTSCEVGEIIDVIDLTDETFYHGPQSYNNVSENYSNLNNSSTTLSYNLRINELNDEQAFLVSTVLDTLAESISLASSPNGRRNRNDSRRQVADSNRNRINDNVNISQEPEEIYLDDTVSPKNNGPWCINDSCTAEPTMLTCAICLEELKTKYKPTATSCGHIFCENCLFKVIRKTKKCPTCQSKITKRSCIRLYF